MVRSVPFTGESLSRYLAAQKRWNEAREWRARESEAGRPFAWTDYCRAQGWCAHCGASGIRLNDTGAGFKAAGHNGSLPLYEECETCGGTGRILKPS